MKLRRNRIVIDFDKARADHQSRARARRSGRAVRIFGIIAVVLVLIIIGAAVGGSGPGAGGTWNSHGHYLVSLVRVARQFLKAGLITSEQNDAIVSLAAQSNCGKRLGEE